MFIIINVRLLLLLLLLCICMQTHTMSGWILSPIQLYHHAAPSRERNVTLPLNLLGDALHDKRFGNVISSI